MFRSSQPILFVSAILIPVLFVVLGIGWHGGAAADAAGETRFTMHQTCAVCHQPGSAQNTALRNAAGEDVSPPSFWRSTMMANAARDPYWQAKVSAEVESAPHLKEFIEDKCSTCHAPMARTLAIQDGADYYSLAQVQEDELALDGVSCTVCHQIEAAGLGADSTFSGRYPLGDQRVIYGPYQDPVASAMLAMSGFLPEYGAHMGKSALCATCHTLFTPTLDASGAVADTLAEQTPYLEWLNSEYPDNEIECQTCHMPLESSPIVVANLPPRLAAREPFYRHAFVGGNAFMLSLMKSHADEIGAVASPAEFDSTIARTRRQLARATATLQVQTSWQLDSLTVEVEVSNLAGHKLPTGFPSRRAWLELRVEAGDGTIKFHSGAWDDNGRIAGLDEPFEPHHELIRHDDQIQVYESVMETPEGGVTFGLLRGARYVKDNRLLPRGYGGSGPYADVTAPSGAAALDQDYVEGVSGSDRLRFRIGGLDPAEDLQVIAIMRYQSVAPRFAEHLFGHETDEVEKFELMYAATSNRPETIDSVQVAAPISATALESLPDESALWNAYPNPSPGLVTLQNIPVGTKQILIFDVLGRRVSRLQVGPGATSVRWQASDDFGRPVPPGLYWAQAAGPDGRVGSAVGISIVR